MKPGGRYRKGYRNEKKSRAWLENQGFLVIEARGSHGLWDLVGVHPQNGTTVLVQVKTNKQPPPGEMHAMRSFPRPGGAVGSKMLHVWKDYQREPEVIEV